MGTKDPHTVQWGLRHGKDAVTSTGSGPARRPVAPLLISALAVLGLLGLGAARHATLRGPLAPARLAAQPLCSPTGPARQLVHVELYDAGTMMGSARGMMMFVRAVPQRVHAGPVTFVATNAGSIVHEMLIMPAPARGVGSRPSRADGTVDESGRLGEASASCAPGVGDGLAPGQTGWVTLNLAAGSYEILCNEPWHYVAGMETGFEVTKN